MGQVVSFFKDLLASFKEQRILLVGLDNAGKTTLLYKLKLGDNVQTVPTIGFNVETIQYKNLDFLIWDVGGQDTVRSLWRHYYSGVTAIIFMVDASDERRLPEAATELKHMLADELLQKAKFLIFANKQDISEALSSAEVTKRLDIGEFKQSLLVQGCSGLTGNGIGEGLEWIASQFHHDFTTGSAK